MDRASRGLVAGDHRFDQIHALRDLRHKLAMEIRREIDPIEYRAPQWFGEYPSLHINPKNPKYPSAVAEVLAYVYQLQGKKLPMPPRAA